MNKLLAIYKPKGPSSNQFLNKIRKIVGTKKVGHAGTLDPLASGVLIVGIEREATKQLNSIVKTEKEYIAEITLGITSTTDDEEGEKTIISNNELLISKKDIERVLQKFTGEIEQIPPIYSAIKVKGQEAYKLARKGQKPVMKSRIVSIKNITILDYKWPVLKIKVTCGSGTYIRSLARDIGKKLKTGAYMSELERTRVGEFDLNNSISIEDLEASYKTSPSR